MSNRQYAKGTFTVDMRPEGQEKAGIYSFGRFALDKKFEGGLSATSKVQMLSAGCDAGTGAYVATEHISGTLDGRTGEFILTHVGTRSASSQQLDITIVPGCGSGALSGITGKMTITIKDKVHYYELEYEV